METISPGNFFGMKSVWPMSKTVTKNQNESKTENLDERKKKEKKTINTHASLKRSSRDTVTRRRNGYRWKETL